MFGFIMDFCCFFNGFNGFLMFFGGTLPSRAKSKAHGVDVFGCFCWIMFWAEPRGGEGSQGSILYLV